MSDTRRVRSRDEVTILLTCEHGGHEVPPEYRTLFEGAAGVLASHRGWDPGALPLARFLSSRWHAPLRFATVSRLVVDLNRSEHHRKVFSERTRGLAAHDREHLLERHHRPHRLAVDRDVAAALRGGGTVLHLGVHSFTPALEGRVRRADFALLYDPARVAERALCAAWAASIIERLPRLAVRRNQPYRGVSDGLTTWLRARHGVRYLGVELEVNQRLLDAGNRLPGEVLDAVAEGLEEALAEGLDV